MPLKARIINQISRRTMSSSHNLLQLRIGFVPEHFSTPLHFAQKRYALSASLLPFPSGTGAMIQALKSSEIDVGIGLTEGWVAGLGKERAKHAYKLIGTYVESPLCWALSTGARRNIDGVAQLKGGKIGVSRIGSGSYVMGFVLADQNGWLEKGSRPFENVVLNDFKGLRDGVNEGKADFFMWEHFTSKRYYDNGEIKRVGEIYTPWSSWKIVAREPGDPRLQDMLDKINKGIKHFMANPEEAIEYISTNLDYSAEDAREWMKTVQFSEDVNGVDSSVIDKTIEILKKASVIEDESVKSDEMIAISANRRAEVT